MTSDRLELSVQVQSLQREVARLGRRLEEVERLLSREASPAGHAGIPESGDGRPLDSQRWHAADFVGFLGRSLVILGGAFLLRAAATAALLPDPAGPLLGLAYAMSWLLVADRTRSPGRETSALFFGLSGLAIAFPLLWETTARFGRLPGELAMPSILVFATAGLLVSARRGLRPLSWVASGGALACSVAVMLGTREFVPYTVVVVLVAAATEGFAIRVRWPELRWAPAATLDLVLVLLTVLVTQPRLSPAMTASLSQGGLVAAALLAPAVYLASVAFVTIRRRRPVTGFEIGQVTTSLLLGVGTAMAAIAAHGGETGPVALALLVVGLAGYAVSFAAIDREAHPTRNFYAYTTFAGVLVATGTMLLYSGAALAWAWLSLGLLSLAVGTLRRRDTLNVHGALYLAGTSVTSGLLAAGFHGLVGPLEATRTGLALAPAASATALGAAYVWLAATRRACGAPARAIVMGALVWSIPGLLAAPLAGLLFAAAPSLESAASLASVRTALLSSTAVLLAWSARRLALRDLAWLVFPVMTIALARMAWEDLPTGGPVHLFVAFAFYGGALVVTSRLLRTAPKPA